MSNRDAGRADGAYHCESGSGWGSSSSWRGGVTPVAALRQGLFEGGSLTILVIIILVGSWSLPVGIFRSTDFHRIFFEGNSWQFSTSDTLIRLFPEQFWFDAALTIGLFTLLARVIMPSSGIWGTSAHTPAVIKSASPLDESAIGINQIAARDRRWGLRDRHVFRRDIHPAPSPARAGCWHGPPPASFARFTRARSASGSTAPPALRIFQALATGRAELHRMRRHCMDQISSQSSRQSSVFIQPLQIAIMPFI